MLFSPFLLGKVYCLLFKIYTWISKSYISMMECLETLLAS